MGKGQQEVGGNSKCLDHNEANHCEFSFVQTDTGNAGARYCGYPEAPDTVEDATAFVAKTVSRLLVLKVV